MSQRKKQLVLQYNVSDRPTVGHFIQLRLAIEQSISHIKSARWHGRCSMAF
jgi:hypothetical protein